MLGNEREKKEEIISKAFQTAPASNPIYYCTYPHQQLNNHPYSFLQVIQGSPVQ